MQAKQKLSVVRILPTDFQFMTADEELTISGKEGLSFREGWVGGLGRQLHFHVSQQNSAGWWKIKWSVPGCIRGQIQGRISQGDSPTWRCTQGSIQGPAALQGYILPCTALLELLGIPLSPQDQIWGDCWTLGQFQDYIFPKGYMKILQAKFDSEKDVLRKKQRS